MAGTPTIRDVARAAGVAVGTVSRVLNGHKSVSADVRHKVLKVIQKLRYEPDRVAQSMRGGVTRTVGCAIRDISIPNFGNFVTAAEQILRMHGYTLLLATTDERKEREMELLRIFLQRRVDAIMMTMSTEEDPDLCRAVKQMKIPILLVDRDIPAEVDSVTIDHRRGTMAATEHLLRLGHERIVLITGRPAMRPGRERIAGFEAAFAAAGKKVDPALIRVGAFSAEFGFREASALLSSSSPPTALIAGGMAMLPGVLRAIVQHGLKIPVDISIVAGSDSDLAALATPPITAIRWSGSEQGRIAVELLLNRLKGNYTGEAQKVLLPTELIIRGSCAPPR
jgi:LacI family transcriptional regulator